MTPLLKAKICISIIFSLDLSYIKPRGWETKMLNYPKGGKLKALNWNYTALEGRKHQLIQSLCIFLIRNHRKTFHCFSWKQPVPKHKWDVPGSPQKPVVISSYELCTDSRRRKAAEKAHPPQGSQPSSSHFPLSGFQIQTQQAGRYRSPHSQLSTAPCLAAASSLADRIIASAVLSPIPSSWTPRSRQSGAFSLGWNILGMPLQKLLSARPSSSQRKVSTSCHSTGDSVTANSSA